MKKNEQDTYTAFYREGRLVACVKNYTPGEIEELERLEQLVFNLTPIVSDKNGRTS